MSASVPLFLPECVIDTVRMLDGKLRLDAHTTALSADCPHCQHPSTRIHSRSFRTLRDLPISDLPVFVILQVRRFFCRQPDCPQRTFAERLPTLVPVRGQRTVRFTRRLALIARALSAEAGARLAVQSQLPTSPDTLLRLMRAAEPRPCPTPRMLGVDDFALKKGRTYGTLLVDLEQRRPIDLLPDRSADTFAAWLRAHPGVTAIARDRSTEYARGATLGAPDALQIADRWHILKNHREALERMLTRLYPDLVRLPLPTTNATGQLPINTRPLRVPSATERAAAQLARTHRFARYQQVQQLVQQGVPLLRIARQLNMSRTTVTKYATTTVFPERATPQAPPSTLDPYRPYLHQRWEAGCTNARQLWREIQARGYPHNYRQVARWTAHQRTGAPTQRGRGARPRLAAPRQLVWLLLRPPRTLNRGEATTLRGIQQHPSIQIAYELAQEFQRLVRQRRATVLDEWLTHCSQSDIAELQTFAKGLQQEYASIRAALSEVWSSGQVEGQVTRLKLVKRQMYGRANFDLLRKRVLMR